MINVIEATALTMEATKVGDVYFRLEKNMFSVKLPLQGQEKGDVDHANFLKKELQGLFYFLFGKNRRACSYPRSDSTNISRNSMSVILGLNFLQKKKDTKRTEQ